MKGKPRVSICIPTYNRSDLLEKTLVSVTKQSIPPYETIVVDNCSEDDTAKVAKSFKGVVYHKNESNLGLAGNWNQCIRLAGGDFLTILHSDDLIAPDWHAQWLEVLEEYSGQPVGAFFLPVFTIDLEETAKIVYYSFAHSRLLPEGESIKILWSRNMCALPASGGILFRKSIFEEIGGFDESLTTETDVLMVLRILNRYPVYYYKKLLYAYRIHPFQTFDKEKQAKSIEKKYSVLQKHLRIFKSFYNTELRQECKQPFFYKRLIYMYVSIGVFHFLTCKFKTAKQYFALIRKEFPDLTFSFTDYCAVFGVILHYIYNLIIGRMRAIPIRDRAKRWL